jgi:hypothetical protein
MKYIVRRTFDLYTNLMVIKLQPVTMFGYTTLATKLYNTVPARDARFNADFLAS